MWSEMLDIQRDNGVTICTNGTVAHDLQQPAQKANMSPAAARLDAGLPSESERLSCPGLWAPPPSCPLWEIRRVKVQLGLAQRRPQGRPELHKLCPSCLWD
ncbi:PREDICTED: uncharacterized protein LOC105525351 [Colobus angolensis palliatus]|uniref:uncharacterized protein LOC105525351 n=1 Tax=Colobus angolensis palliatus TaxID=336983 RepID=UPI0005F3C167|nr:PREDICTED: uncharacterized protein LOC105525351 [Colobus angolensis palliatus]